MRIKIKTERHTIHLAFPNRLFLNRVALSFLKKNDSEGMWKNVKPSQMRRIRRTIRQMRKTHKGWYLVEAESADGTGVKIKL